MSLEKTKLHVPKQESHNPDSDPLGGGPSALQQQAATWAQVARQARQECEKGKDAERALEKRRNRSGQ